MTATTGKFYTWAIRRTESKRAPLWIGLLFFLELVLFIPLDAIFVFFCLQNRRHILLYIGIAALASTLSGLCGYFLGHYLWDCIGPYLVPHFISAAVFERFAGHFQQFESLAVFIGAFLPFPLKALSLSAGICHLKLPAFFLWLSLARACRFILLGLSMVLWGDQVKTFVDRHFHRILIAIGAKIALAFGFFWIFLR